MSGPYGYPNTGAYHPGTNVTHATAEGYTGADDYGHHQNADHYATGGADEYENEGSEPHMDTTTHQYTGDPAAHQYAVDPASHQYAPQGVATQYAGATPGAPNAQFSGEQPNYRFWIPSEGISRRVIQHNITAFLGPEARVMPGIGVGEDAGKQGYWYSAYRHMTDRMVEDLKKFTLAEKAGPQPAGRLSPPGRHPERSDRAERSHGSRQGVTPPLSASAPYPPPQSGRSRNPRTQDPYSTRPPNPAAYPPTAAHGDRYAPNQYSGPQQGNADPYGYATAGATPSPHGGPPVAPYGSYNAPPPANPPYNQAYPNQGGPRQQYPQGFPSQGQPQQPQGGGYYPQTAPSVNANVPPGFYLGQDGQLWPLAPPR